MLSQPIKPEAGSNFGLAYVKQGFLGLTIFWANEARQVAISTIQESNSFHLRPISHYKSLTPLMEEGSGTLSPISSTTSTAVEHQTNELLLFSSTPPKSPIIGGDSSSTLAMQRRNPNRPREQRSFSSVQKLPVLEPSTSPVRRRFDLLLLWILQTLTWWYISIVATKRRIVNNIWGLLYDWHARPWWGKYMIQRDIASLRKLPRHVAVILDQRKTRREYDADETLRRATELITWCACAGIYIVTVYEPTGFYLSHNGRV